MTIGGAIVIALVAFFAGWLAGYKQCSRDTLRWLPDIWKNIPKR